MNYNRGDVVIVPFPFVTSEGTLQKARPALIISCEYIMTVPRGLVARKLGHLPDETIKKIDKKLKLSLGIEE
jgi:mRNA-degrading endonuclease toxin of MazEF toxin-antitoxin module